MLSVSVGVPVTVTGSVNATVIVTAWPARYAPSAVEELALVTVGDVVSKTKVRVVVPVLPAASVERAVIV